MVRAAGTTALVLLVALGFSASPASAEPLSMTFTEGRANVGVQLSVADDADALFKAPSTAAFSAQINPGSGLITGGVLQVPEFSTDIADPVVTHVMVDFEIGIINGSFNEATGALSLSGVAGGTLTADGKECNVSTPSPATLTLTTDGSTGGPDPLHGTPFTHGLTGSGAIAGEWQDMSATPIHTGPGGDTVVCAEVEEHIEGPGGIWLYQEGDVTPPATPKLTSTNPASPGSSGTPQIRGSAEAGSTVRVYAGSSCGAPVATATAGELASPGIAVKVEEGVSATFSATATDAAGNTSACSAPISYTRLKSTSEPKPSPACVVPKLAGKTLKAARRKLKAAGCEVGEVRRPRGRKGRKLGPLIVKSSSPAAGSSPADGEVDVRLGVKRSKARQ